MGAPRLGRILLILAVTIQVACATVSHEPLRPATPVPTATPAPIQLPADDSPHDDLTEWWYYTGHLATTSGTRYGFEFVVFQVKREGILVSYAAHAAITDHQRQEFHYAQRSWSVERAPTTFDLGDGSWQLSGDGAGERLKASAAGFQLDLKVRPTKPPALHGNNGVISFGPVGDSYYYSSTRLSVTGVVVDNGVDEPVTGEAWKDRQWGNFLVTPAGGWDWISAQLDDGTELMLFLLRDAQGKTSPAYGTWIDPEGKTKTLGANGTRVTARGTWASPHSSATYPSGWSVEIAEEGLQLTLAPVIPDQELDTRSSTGQIYWEGEVTAIGQRNGKPIAGEGYVELTGYASAVGKPSP